MSFMGVQFSPNHQEVLLGSLKPSRKEGVMVDDDGYMSFELVGENEMDVCYAQTDQDAKVASCYRLTRQTPG